jgi:Reverse transcriptase-like
LAILAFQEMALTRGVILTDCQQLAHALSDKQPPLHLDWWLYGRIIQAWLFFKAHSQISIKFVGRNIVTEAHKLANWARIGKNGISYNFYHLPVM